MARTTKYIERDIPEISLKDFTSRIDEITKQICDAAENVGFFAIIDHGIATEDMDAMFDVSESFFRLPDEVKATVPWNPNNVGWEKMSQVRPSTGAADMKESYQLQFGDNMKGLWMSDEHLPGFRDRCLAFMHRLQDVSEMLMVCVARGLGFEDDYFIRAHDPAHPDCLSVMRLLHYFPTPRPEETGGEGNRIYHRAGAHADWGFLTLLLQRAGQSGLEICPGREAVTEFALGDAWTRVDFSAGAPGAIVCNIGDMLMSWSDDRFKSTFHRVKAPHEPGDYYGERFSIAFFNQPAAGTVIQGPQKKYPPVTGGEFIRRALAVHFTALQAKLKAQAGAEEKEAVNRSSRISSVEAAA
ncbi:oxoglutarate/iron-dependent oxygenase [Biscogniauxia marginata]|nr:oxoglutarate/iron-dependent oxygenase [Biscogniauxia marginata]